MSPRQFELSTTAPVEPDFAFQFMMDLNNHRHLHPFFVAAEVVSSGVDASGHSYQDFIVTERPRLALFRYTITFPTRMMVTGDCELTSQVQAALKTRLTNVVRCRLEQGKTRITETVTVDAPWPTIGYVTRQAHIAHQRTFSLLPSALAKLSEGVAS